VNYLAHVFLSRETPEAILGALYGDFVKGAPEPAHSSAIRAAIALHRAIDRFTDAHRLTCASRALVSPARRRFAPILIDVFYDHFLARRWHEYCDLPLATFARQVYDVLLTHYAQLPARLQFVAPRMAAHDWFGAYAGLDGMDAAVNGIARRLARHARAAALHGGVEELRDNYDALDEHFRAFFPELVRFADEHRAAAVHAATLERTAAQPFPIHASPP
jgi:acyl carrier protein phosphodiesterase